MPRARYLLLLLLTLLTATAQAGLGPTGHWGHTLTLLLGVAARRRFKTR